MSETISIAVQAEDFSAGEEYEQLRKQAGGAGAFVFFTGQVRPDQTDDPVMALDIEHYPGMTEASLQAIASQANERWSLKAIRIIHRIAYLAAGEQIVFVGVGACHRAEAFAAAEYIMDYLKTRAPFWKKEHRDSGSSWVEAKSRDLDAAMRWADEN